MTARPLLIGESNPYGGDPRLALYPSPSGSSGHRLATLVLGLSPGDYLRRFDRANLVVGPWSYLVARMAASATRAERLVLLGRRVCGAFDVGYEPLRLTRFAGRSVLVLPHPSGLCRFWNERRNVLAARRAVEELCGSRDPGGSDGRAGPE